MKIILIFITILVQGSNLTAENLDSLLLTLIKEIGNKNFYDSEKERELQNIKYQLNVNNLSPKQEYDINSRLSEEYRKYNIDSAIYYLDKNLLIAESLNDYKLKVETRLHLSLLYSIVGMFIESYDMIDEINRNTLPEELLPRYYEVCYYLNEHYAQSCDSDIYWQKHDMCRDSLLMTLDEGTFLYEVVYIGKLINMDDNSYTGTAKERLDLAEKRLKDILSRLNERQAEYAFAAYLLSNVYKQQGNTELQKKYLMMSAISDIKNSIKENASMHSLAILYYQSGNIDLAYRFIMEAMNDMAFCNVRFRSIELSDIHTIINTAYLEKEIKNKDNFQLYFLLISMLSVFLIIAVLYVYKQMKKNSGMRKELSATNNSLTELNQRMNQMNDKLYESNLIKEDYIANFFNLCSAYIDKWDTDLKTLYKKALAHQHDDLFRTLKSFLLVDVDDERKKLYDMFDSIFLNLYPTFVEEFNALLIPKKQVVLKPGELLNAELRIFALIRLGIADSIKIAGFLHYSTSTVYNYRSVARNNAVVSRENFEEMVMKIGVIQEKKQQAG
jgi:hypothetical protein